MPPKKQLGFTPRDIDLSKDRTIFGSFSSTVSSSAEFIEEVSKDLKEGARMLGLAFELGSEELIGEIAKTKTKQLSELVSMGHTVDSAMALTEAIRSK